MHRVEQCITERCCWCRVEVFLYMQTAVESRSTSLQSIPCHATGLSGSGGQRGAAARGGERVSGEGPSADRRPRLPEPLDRCKPLRFGYGGRRPAAPPPRAGRGPLQPLWQRWRWVLRRGGRGDGAGLADRPYRNDLGCILVGSAGESPRGPNFVFLGFHGKEPIKTITKRIENICRRRRAEMSFDRSASIKHGGADGDCIGVECQTQGSWRFTAARSSTNRSTEEQKVKNGLLQAVAGVPGFQRWIRHWSPCQAAAQRRRPSGRLRGRRRGIEASAVCAGM